MHMIGRMVQRGQPSYDDIRLIHQVVGQPQQRFYGLGIQKKAIERESKHADNAADLAFFQVKQQHDGHHQKRIKHHQQKDRCGTGIGLGHFQCLYKGGQGNGLSRTGVAQNRRRFRPHISHEALSHADKRSGDQNKNKVNGSRGDDVHSLSQYPRFPVNPHEVERCSRTDKGHIRKEKHQQQGGQQNGICISKCPDERLQNLHDRSILSGKLHGLVGQKETQNKAETERDDNAAVFVPLPEVIPRNGEDLLDFHILDSLLLAAMPKQSAAMAVSSDTNRMTPVSPNIQRSDGEIHSFG